MKIKDIALENRPRERFERQGASVLSDAELLPADSVIKRIHTIREIQVMIDSDLAELYCVPVKALNQAVKRNKKRFPDDFMFQLTKSEKNELVTKCDYLKNLKFSPNNPYAFTGLVFNYDPRLSLLAGYAGTDILEGVYKSFKTEKVMVVRK